MRSNSYFIIRLSTAPASTRGAYYTGGFGGSSGWGSGVHEYFTYLGDAFSDATGPSSGSMFPFAYRDEGQQFAHARPPAGSWLLGKEPANRRAGLSVLQHRPLWPPGVFAKHGLLRDPKGVGTIRPGLEMQPGKGPEASPDGSSVRQVGDNLNGMDVMPTAEGVNEEAWDDPNWRLGPWGSFFGTIYGGIAGVGKVLTYPGRFIPGTREFWESRDRALQHLYDACNIGGSGWQTMSEVGSGAAAVALTWGIAPACAGAAGTAGASAEQAVIRLAARLRFTQTTAAHMANPGR